MINQKELKSLANALSFGSIDSIQSIAGGDINEAYQLKVGNKAFFLKKNTERSLSGLFEAEAKALKLLRQANCLKIPRVIRFWNDDQAAYLLLEFIPNGRPSQNFWESFAEALAKLHQVSQASFGLDHDNFIGRLKQSNKTHDTWHNFFILERLEPMLRLAVNTSSIPKTDLRSFEKLFARLQDFFPVEKPAMLHGDLWSGNYLINREGQACIFDPALYFGHREMDIAMTKLFGGFDARFYEHYNNYFPLENDWEERLPVANLYPLLVHVNLFGASYYRDVKKVLNTYC